MSVNDLILKAWRESCGCAQSANMSVTPDGRSAIAHQRVDVSVAVALDDGLITPVVRGADGKSLGALAKKCAIWRPAVATKAKVRGIPPAAPSA